MHTSLDPLLVILVHFLKFLKDQEISLLKFARLQDLEDHLAAHRFHDQWLDNDMKMSNSPADITVRTPSGMGGSFFGGLVGKGREV